ncbi:MAG: hypothetical protein ABI388_06745 [Bacteroidia bacterium]
MPSQHKITQKIELGFVTLSLIKPNIICVDTLIEESINVDKGIQILEAVKALSGNQPYATIINVSDLYAPSKDFFKFIVSQRSAEKDNIVARAIVTTNPASRLDGQNFINFFKPLTPTKLFSTIDEAIAWLEPQLKD